MSLTGVKDVDIHIISFCNFKTIKKLLFLQRLVEESVLFIIEANLDNEEELSVFVIDLIDLNEIELAQKFIKIGIDISIKCESDFGWDYYTIFHKYLRQDVLEIYFTSGCDYNDIVQYIKEHFTEDFEFKSLLYEHNGLTKQMGYLLDNLLTIFQAAINVENTIILKFLLDYCSNGLYCYRQNFIRIMLNELDQFLLCAEDICNSSI